MSLSKDKEYMLKSLPKNGKAHGNFQWPTEEGTVVSAPDWDPKVKCGNGLHGLYRGVGDISLLCSDNDALWYILEVDPLHVVDLDWKVKVPSCKVSYCGKKDVAISLLAERYPTQPVAYAQVRVGDNETAITGIYGNSISGSGGTSISKAHGSSISGPSGTSITGYRGTCRVGEGGIVKGGYGSVLYIQYWEESIQEYREKAVISGFGQVKTNVAYKLDKQNNFIEVK